MVQYYLSVGICFRQTNKPGTYLTIWLFLTVSCSLDVLLTISLVSLSPSTVGTLSLWWQMQENRSKRPSEQDKGAGVGGILKLTLVNLPRGTNQKQEIVNQETEHPQRRETHNVETTNYTTCIQCCFFSSVVSSFTPHSTMCRSVCVRRWCLFWRDKGCCVY